MRRRPSRTRTRGEARGRGDRDDVSCALLSHDRQDRARHVHRADEICGQLLVYLVWREFLEAAGVVR